MEFLHIYLVAGLAIFSLAGIIIYKVIQREQILGNTEDSFIEKYIKDKERELVQGRIDIPIETFIALKALLPVAFGLFGYIVLKDQAMMLVLSALGFFLPDIFLSFKRDSEKKKFESRFIRALGQMASSLHSGMTIEQAIDSVIKCELLHETIKEDFKMLSSKLKLGVSISNAFYEYADMTGSKDVADVATAITIMTSLGGDAGVAVEKIQKNIEDRLLYRKKRSSMMTESKILTIASDVVPVIILAGSFVFMPDAMMEYVRDPDKIIILAVIVGLLLLGSLIVHKMLNNKIDAT